MKKYSLYRQNGNSSERDALRAKYPQCAEYGNLYLFPETHEQAFGVPASNIVDYSETRLIESESNRVDPNEVSQANFDVQLTATLAGGIPANREIKFNRQTGRYFRDTKYPPPQQP